MTEDIYPLAMAFLVLLSIAASFFAAVFVWVFVASVCDEIRESIQDHRVMRNAEKKRLNDTELDEMFAKWAAEFKEQPLGSLGALSNA